MTAQTFRGEILVASRIVDSLSSGLYETPAACLKELVNNAYDADATTVRIFVKPDADRLIITDDGTGFDRQEFERHFSRISESHKRDETDVTAAGRPKIGKIGIGFIAANELCDVMEIISTKAGSTQLLNVDINFAEMREAPEKRKRDGDDYAKGDYEGVVSETDRDTHYTHIFLKGVRGEARAILAGATRAGGSGAGASLYGLKPDTITSFLASGRFASWLDLDQYSQTLVEVGLNVPVRYPEKWMPEDARRKVTRFVKSVEGLDFNVLYDGIDLRKPVAFGRETRHVIHTFTIAGEHVGATGYLYAQHGAIVPRDLNGLLVRIRHAAVGDYDDTFMGYPKGTGQLFQRWISGEIWADDRLEEAMNIDRRTLRVTHSAYVELQERIHREVDKILSDIRRELWATGSEERRTARAGDQSALLSEVVARKDLPLTARERSVIAEAFAERPAATKRYRHPVLREYTVAELYEVVLEVAAEHMDKQAFRRFATALTERLQRLR
jgi:hypothetical protein